MIVCEGPTCQGRTNQEVPNIAWFEVKREQYEHGIGVHHFCGAGCLSRWLKRYLP